MKFSIIIPVYNVEKYLPVCIESIVKQTYTDFEVILVDDGSTDSSPDLCDKYADECGSIHVIHQSNKGLSSARNNGVKKATGEYILFLDSDDYYSDVNCLEKIQRVADGCDIVAYNWASFDCDCISIKVKEKGPMRKMAHYYCNGQEYLSASLEAMPLYPWYIWVYSFRREYWLSKGFAFKEGIKFEDLDLTYRVILSAKKINVIPDSLYIYRENRNGSTVSTLNYKSARDMLSHAKKNILDVEKNFNIQDRLKVNLRNNFASSYYYVLNRCSELPGKQRKRCIELLKEYKWMCNYTKGNLKHMVEHMLLQLFGVKMSCWLFGNVRHSIKKC